MNEASPSSYIGPTDLPKSKMKGKKRRARASIPQHTTIQFALAPSINKQFLPSEFISSILTKDNHLMRPLQSRPCVRLLLLRQTPKQQPHAATTLPPFEWHGSSLFALMVRMHKWTIKTVWTQHRQSIMSSWSKLTAFQSWIKCSIVRDWQPMLLHNRTRRTLLIFVLLRNQFTSFTISMKR